MKITSIKQKKFLRGIGGSVLGIPWFELERETKPNQRAAWFYVLIGL